MTSDGLRWRVVDDQPQGQLFEPMVREIGRGEFRGMEFLHVRAQRIINELKAPTPLPFRFTINAYRGCSHACVFCFARPTHEYLGLGAGEDFDRRIVVKVNAVERLRAELNPARWPGHPIAMGTNTDPYQRCEGKYRLTRGIVEVLAEAANPFSILTKSTLIRRDLGLLVEAAQRTDVRINLSIGTLDEDVWRTTEPGTPHPRQRLKVVEELNRAGVACGVLVAPVLPGLSDRPEQLEAVARACAEAGAVSVSASVLHLRPGVKEHFLEALARSHPHLVDQYRDWYGDRAYLPRAQQRRVSEAVSSGSPPMPVAEPKAQRPKPRSPAPAQLHLSL